MSLAPFEEVVTEHGAALRRVCRALVGTSDADDLWSETFLAALRAYPRLRADSNVRGWLVTIAHHKSVDHLRKSARNPVAQATLAGVREVEVPDAGSRDGADALRAALDTLPHKQRGAVIYRYLADCSYAEIGRLLDCTAVAARRNAADGIARLRRVYQQDAEES